ncbi:signal recognition particle-docking protein FtsY [Candidatus Babeliales bacterium]|nr:signal recognition particle-docking protein FtsY [Candidatus Babeliales bacterium]MCF7899874.1 signal recognition particle-docking protein FtsY [Candidatus Babeliales bacterium]
MFNFLKNKIKKVYDNFTNKACSIFSRDKLDESFLKELSVLLISADTGIKTTNKILEILKTGIQNKKIENIEQAKAELEKLLLAHLKQHTNTQKTPKLLLLVGINGSGKTTFVAKFANKLKNEDKKILLVAGDTFRAAAVDQLLEWSKKINVDIFIGKTNQDPASVIFDACKKFKEENYDHIIIDTAGRLQTKANLMKELEKIRNVVGKVLPDEQINTWLTIDSMLGQNSLSQAEIFNESTKLDGLVLTKLDGTGKGGIVFSITEKLQLPILYITYGEQLEDIKNFDAEEYVKNLFEE